MSEMMSINVGWPSALPLPSIDYTGRPVNATIRSDLSRGGAYVLARSRFWKPYAQVDVAWVFTDAQYEAFRDFFENDLYVGAALFTLEIRYPRNSVLEEWVVRFAEGYSVNGEDGSWVVTAPLFLLTKTALEDPSDSPLREFFYAAGNEEFLTDVGEPLSVKITT